MFILFHYLKNLFSFLRKRSLVYTKRSGNRYWWYRFEDTRYIPPVYSFLTDWEWAVIESWYRDTDRKKLIGEANLPLINVLQGFIMGSAASNIVQLGHYAGYSTLLVGFMLRKMNRKNSFFTIDIDPNITRYVQKWVDRAGLSEYVKVQTGNSSDPEMVELVREYFGGRPKMVFIDSSHQYGHTLEELDLWYAQLEPGGLIFLHDTSDFARQYDSTGQGGVKRALDEWTAKESSARVINLNAETDPQRKLVDHTYRDGCGLGIIQK